MLLHWRLCSKGRLRVSITKRFSRPIVQTLVCHVLLMAFHWPNGPPCPLWSFVFAQPHFKCGHAISPELRTKDYILQSLLRVSNGILTGLRSSWTRASELLVSTVNGLCEPRPFIVLASPEGVDLACRASPGLVFAAAGVSSFCCIAHSGWM